MTQPTKIFNEIEEIIKSKTWRGDLNRQVQTQIAAIILLQSKLRSFADIRKRSTLIYHSIWPILTDDRTMLNSKDALYLSSIIRDLSPEQGVDFLINTPGGDPTVADSIVTQLKSHLKDNDIEVFVHYGAMSAGTMMACAARLIHMANGASLGPTDPILGDYRVTGLLSDRAIAEKDFANNPGSERSWQIHDKIPAGTLSESIAAINWLRNKLETYLKNGMYRDNPEAKEISQIIEHLTDLKHTGPHSSRIAIDQARKIGLKVKSFDDNKDIADMLYGIWDTCSFLSEMFLPYKIYINSNGVYRVGDNANPLHEK